MRQEFAIAIDPIMISAIGMMEKIELGTTLDPAEARRQLLGKIERADRLLGASLQWELSRYAVVSWIDEMLLTMPWPGATWWREHILEMELFQTRDCSTRFFELAKEASGLAGRDALEVFYNCVLLGFRGMYANPEFASNTSLQRGWPSSIEKWQDMIHPMVMLSSGTTESEGMERMVAGAPPLRARNQFLWWSVAAFVFILLNCAVFRFQDIH